MSLSKEHSQDKAEWVKWPHLETQWQPQNYGTPHRAVKKGGDSRSHSWWWDSHISPKSSKWLQENLAEMDSKVSAMLKIIEEDADSFAKRAEMYYKRRPELVILVEEFYRTYRALVERHTFLTKELRQNIAPALQAQLGASYSTPPNPLSDLLGRPGSDGFEIASLSSYTFPGALEFDEDNLIDVSEKKSNEDVEDAPSASSRVSFETREYEFKPSSSSSEEEPFPPHPQHREMRMPVDATSLIELKKRMEKLEDEKKASMIKSGEDSVKITDLQSEVSNLLMKAKELEAEEKLANKRINSLLQLKLLLEAENLKLNHGLIACKEEKTRLTEDRDHGVQEMLATRERICQLEQEVFLLERKMAASHAEALSGLEQAKKFKDECEKLQQALIASEDENQRDVIALQEAYESRFKELQKQALHVEKENEGFKKQIAVQTLKVQELEQQATEVTHIRRQSAQDLVNSKESKDALELALLSRIHELQKELEATENSKQQSLEQIVLRDGRVSMLEETVRDVQEHKAKLETERDELGMQMVGLEAKYQELEKERDRYLAYSQRLDSQCKALEAADAQLQEKLVSLLKESTSLREEKIASESLLAQARLEVEELRLRLSAFSSDRSLLLQRACGIVNTFQIGDNRSVEESGLQTTHLRDLELVLTRLVLEKNMLEKRQAEAQHLLSEAEKASEAERVKSRKTAYELVARVAELDSRLATLVNEKDLLEERGREAFEFNSKLKADLSLIEKEKVEASKLVGQLLSENEELKKTRDLALVKCQNIEVEFLALKQVEERLRAQLEVKLVEGVSLQNDKSVLEADLTQVRLEMKELQLRVSALLSEKASLKLELGEASEQVRITNISNSELHGRNEEYRAKHKKIEDDLRSQSTQLEEVVSSLLQEKKALESDQAEAQKVRQCLEEEKQQLTAELLRLHQAVSSPEESISIPIRVQSRSLDADLLPPGSFEHIHHKVGSLLEERRQLLKEVGSQKVEKVEMTSKVRCLEKDKDAVHRELLRALEGREQMVILLGGEATKGKHLEEELKRTQQSLHHSIEDKVTVTGQLKTATEEGENLRNDLKALQDELKKNQVVALEATRDSEKLTSELSQLKQANALVENELNIKLSELSSAHEHASKLLLSKGVLEEELQQHLHQIRTLNEKVERLQHQLQDAQQKIGGLEDELSKQYLDGNKAACEAEKEISKQIATVDSLEQEMAVMHIRMSDLEQDASSVRDEKKVLYGEAEALRLELKGAQGERESLMLHMKDRESHLEERELENRSLQEQLHAAERATVEAKEEIGKHIAQRDSLNLGVTDKLRRLESDLTCVKDEKETLTSSLKGMQLKMTGIQGEHERLKAQLKAASLELEGKETETMSMQEQLKATESHSSSLAKALSSVKSSLGAQVEGLQEEVVQLESTKIQIQKDLAIQLEWVSKLKDELSGLHDATSVLQEERDLGNKEIADLRREAAGHLNKFETARKRECDKDAEFLELSALAESLKQSLLAKDLENLKLLEDFRKSAECQSAAEKRYMDEVGFLQSEELKWRTEVSANSALMAEKVASLRKENAALHQDLSSKIELVLKQQQEVESLTEENKNLSQVLQEMSADMQEIRNDLQIFKEVVIPSMEERAVDLQDVNRRLAASNEIHVAEIVRLRAKLEEAEGELVLLHGKNSILTIEHIFAVEMLKHVTAVVLEPAKAQSERLCDKLGYQEKHCHMLEQMLTRATDENRLVSQKLSSVTQEKSSLVAEVHYLLAILAEVEQLRRELVSEREGSCPVRESEPAEVAIFGSLSNSHTGDAEAGGPIQFGEQIPEPTQNIRGGFQDPEVSVSAPVHKLEQGCSGSKHEEIAPSLETQKQKRSSLLTFRHSLGAVESDGSTPIKVGSVSSSPVVIEQLKEEISFLQEKIKKFELEDQVTRNLPPGADEDLLISPSKKSTTFSSSISTVEDTQDRLDDLQKVKDRNLIEEIKSLKGHTLAAWMEHNLIENTVRDLQTSKALLQETNEHLNSELHSNKESIVRLKEELSLLQQKHAALLQEVEVLTQGKKESDETLRMLKGVIGTLELSNRHLQVENEHAGEELKQLQGSLASLQEEGTELVARMKVKLVSTFEELKLVIDECRREMGEEGFSQVMMVNGLSCSAEHVDNRISLLESKQGMVTESFNEKGTQETVPGLVPKNRLFLTELQARAEEANMLLEVLMCIRKLLLTFFSSSVHTCQRDTLFTGMDVESMKEEEEASILVETTSLDKDLDLVGSVHHHIKLAERLHQAFVDETLEQELKKLNEGRKQLKEDLTLRLDEVQRMELELKNLEMRLEEEMSGKREGVARHEEKGSKKKRLEEHVKELREMLVHQRGQISKLKEEIMFGEEQREATAEDQVTVLVSMESAPNMDGWDDEQEIVLSKELESLRSLNRRHSAELRTISQDLQSMGSIIKSAQDHLLLEEPSEDGEEEILSIADLRTQKSNIIDLRAGQNSRLSVDSTQQLLSPSPHMVEGDPLSARPMSSDGSVGQFALKPRNFGLTWFMLLFNSDRKASSLVRGKSDKAVWAALRRSRRSSGGRAALVGERGRRKAARSCLACVSNTNRLDSFEHR